MNQAIAKETYRTQSLKFDPFPDLDTRHQFGKPFMAAVRQDHRTIRVLCIVIRFRSFGAFATSPQVPDVASSVHNGLVNLTYCILKHTCR